MGVPVSLCHHPDQLPLGNVRFRPHLKCPHHLLFLPAFSVLLNEAPLGHTLGVIQHHLKHREVRIFHEFMNQDQCNKSQHFDTSGHKTQVNVFKFTFFNQIS